MKIIFITATLTIIWYMRKHKTVSQTYSKDEDTFKSEFLLVPCFLLALLINHELSVMEVSEAALPLHGRPIPCPGADPVISTPQVLWTFSIYLEAVAILPQLVMLQNCGNVDNLTGHYVFFLGCVQQACPFLVCQTRL
jgi:ER lumen protein retaining receptor